MGRVTITLRRERVLILCQLLDVARRWLLSAPEGAPESASSHDGRTVEPRTYSVTVVAQRASRAPSRVEIGPTTWASSFRHDKSALLIEVPIQAERAQVAYRNAYELVTAFLRLLGTEGVGYRIGDHDERVELKVVAEGPHGPRIDSYSQNPFVSVVEGPILPTTVQTIITTSELFSTQTVQANVLASIFDSRDQWPEPVCDALALYWEGQCSHDHNVQFALSVSALEVLVDAANPREKLFNSRFDSVTRKQTLGNLRELLRQTGKLEDAEVERVCDSVSRADRVGTSKRFADYLNMHLKLDGRPDFYPLAAKQVAELLQQRGRYLHAGKVGDEELRGQRWELIKRVGRCLRVEISKHSESRTEPSSDSAGGHDG